MIITSTDSGYQEALSALIGTQSWFHSAYTQSTLQYYRQRPADELAIVDDRSFLLEWEGRPVIAFQGAAVSRGDTTDLLAFEAPCNTIENKPLCSSNVVKRFLREFDRRSEVANGAIWYRDFLKDGELSFLSKHLLKKGATVSPIFSQVIDLDDERATKKASVRKSYASLINWGNRELQPMIYDASDISWDVMNQFRQLHIREAGTETRSEESWRRQLDMVLAGEAFVVFGRQGVDVVSAGFFSVSINHCCYGSSASRRDLFNKPLFHALMWTALLHAKKLGCRWFEMGERVFTNHPFTSPPSEKELGISQFKAGFGGETRTYLNIELKISKKDENN